MGLLTDLMRNVLLYFYNLSGNFGIAIILLTILTRVILFPLYVNQIKTTAKMKEIQPAMKEIQTKFKDDPQEQQKRMLELYKKHNYNPLSGCLPLLLQLPFIWAVFGALRSISTNLPPEPFSSYFFGWNLIKPDPYMILPVISGLTTYWSMSQTATDPSQKSMLIMMPIFLTWMSTRFEAGLVLYWIVGNLFAIAQHYWMSNRSGLKRGGSEA